MVSKTFKCGVESDGPKNPWWMCDQVKQDAQGHRGSCSVDMDVMEMVTTAMSETTC